MAVVERRMEGARSLDAMISGGGVGGLVGGIL